MNKRKTMVLATVLVCGLLLTGSTLAMSSTNYRLDWFTPLTGSGGGPAESAHYAVNLTVGQAAIGAAASSSYQACLGYWCGVGRSWRVCLPLVLSGFVDTAQVIPHIISPVDGTSYVFGQPVEFRAVDDAHICGFSPYDVKWHFRFRRPDQEEWDNIPAYQFSADRLLQNWVILVRGEYEVTAEICCGPFFCAESPPVSFTVDYQDPPVAGETHPNFANYDWIDWADPENDSHVTTAHFNMFWNTQLIPDDETLDETLGFLECVWATLDREMLSPLDDASIYRHYEDYDPLTRITVLAGWPGGGGHSQPQGLGYGSGIGTRNWVLAHELFHVFDYAGNPLHNKPWFDQYRQTNNAYIFFHEATTGVEQTMARDAFTVWGYRTDDWPYWVPLDLGLLELDYNARPFWAYLINNYGFEPRLTWEGPPTIDACQPDTQTGHPPHNFKLFEAWNAEVRNAVREELGPGAALADYGGQCPSWHRNPDWEQRMFLYNGEIRPPCLQTLEYEMAVLEEMSGSRFPVAGTPLEESLMLDFAVKFAEAFPPTSLLSGMPTVVSCDLTGITFARGFEEVHDPEDPADACAEYGAPPVITPPLPICAEAAALNEHDFYARIKFNIKEDRAKFLRIQANDDATVYVDGKAVIGDTDPEDQDLDNPDMSFPNASATYADQNESGWFIHAPVSNIFPVGDPRARTFEIEWVNRGDGLGNADALCDPDRSRYLLTLEWYNAFSHTFGPIGPDQVEVLSAEFWPGQGSGNPGFVPPPIYNGDYAPLLKEIQLRPVSEGERPFLLPSLGVHYHPVQCPVGYTGDLEVTIRDDRLTHTEPSVHLMVIKEPETVQWTPGVVEEVGDAYAISLDCRSGGQPATYGGDPAFLLVTVRRTLHCDPANDSCDPPEYACDPDNPGLCDPPVNPYGTMGVIHYTIIIAQAAPILRTHLPTPWMARPVSRTPMR